jgi:uncharacterized phage protein gp47/JayE
MPWHTPTLRDVRGQVRDYIQSTLPGSDANVPNSVLRVLSDSQGGLCHLTLQYIDWLALMLLPDTAEDEWLDRHGKIWLVNADGSTGRKVATLSKGVAQFNGLGGGNLVPKGTQLTANTVGFETMEDVYVDAIQPTRVPIRALDPGSAGNLPDGTELGMVVTIPGVDQTAYVVHLAGGTDTETDEQLRSRILRRIQQPPMGGSAYDYEAWALAVPGVTRAWCAPLEMGIGTVTIRFMMDDLRADNDGFPLPQDVEAVRAYIDSKRPVATKDFFVEAPVKQPITCIIEDLEPNTEAVRAQIDLSLREMLLVAAAPGQTIYAAWKNYAIMNAAGVVSFRLVNNDDDVMQSPGHMAVLGNIIYE